MFSKKIFGERILEQRKKHKETQDALAEVLSVKNTTVSEIENGKKTTVTEKLYLICRHYNVSADYLLGLTDDPKPHKRKKEEET